MSKTTHSLLLTLVLAYTSLNAQIPCNGEFVTSGDATNMGGCIELTPDETGQSGCAWLDTPIDFNEPFTHTMSANFGDDDNGADGICLVYQPGGVGACGGQGVGIGAQGIPNSFIVEFDTWDNGPGQGDIPADHCAVSLDGNLANQIAGPVPLANIEDGANHTITFEWDPATMIYTITFDGVVLISAMYDIVNDVFNGNNLAYWGYTSATGAADNQHLVCPVIPPPVVVDAGADATVPCADGAIVLNATAPMGSNYTYSWSSPNGGQILSGGNTLNPTVQGPGTYVLTLTDQNGGCQEIDEVQVTIEPLLAIIDAPPFAPCAGGTVTLDGSASSFGPSITYQWSTAGGQILGPTNQATIQAGAPGQYTLTVTFNNGLGICTATTSVVLAPDPDVPVAIAFPDTLNCINPTVTIDASNSSAAGPYTYQWTTANGQILSGANSLFPTVGAPGDYTLTILNTSNNCTGTTTVAIAADFVEPVAEASASGLIDCNNSAVWLSASGSTMGDTISYSWLTSDGSIVNGADSAVATVDSPGEYTLFVEDTDNGCFQTATVNVMQGDTLPNILIAAPDTFTCADTLIGLSAGPSTPVSSLQYQWSTLNGQISGTDTLANATAADAGTYLLTTTDSITGCVATDSIVVPANTLAPPAEAGNGLVLSCGQTTATLDGSGSAMGPEYAYQWTSDNGSVLSGGSTLNPVVGSAGLYQIQVTNTGNGCSATDTVTISSDINLPPIQIAPPDTLDCAQPELVLDASGSAQGAPYLAAWSTSDGQFTGGTDGLSPTIDAPGTYTLSITDTLNACEAISTIEVVQDTVSPTLSIAMPDTLNCALTSLQLNASNSDQGANFSYEWTSSNGNLTTDTESLTPTVDAAGTYELQITNTANQCQATGTVEVIQDTLAPTLQIAAPAMLNCEIDSLQLDASGSSTGSRYAYSWTGTIDSGADALTPTVSQAGTYLLTILDVQNLCSRTDSVQVAIDTLAPPISAGADQLLNCYTPQLQLPGSGTGDSSRWAIQWSSADGQIIDGSQTFTPTVDSAGTYALAVTDTINACQSFDTLSVAADFAPPTATIAPPPLLTCTDTLLTLDATASSNGTNFDYQWQHSSGGILSGADSPQPTISQAGIYRLTVTDTDNGCTALDSVTVQQDTDVPTAAVAPPATLTCANPTVELDAGSSTQGVNITLSWASADGRFLNGENSLQPTVDAAGTYTLTLLDTLNNCQSIAAVAVTVDTLAPLAEAGDTLLLNCYQPTAALDASASTAGASMDYSWSSPDGNLLSGTQGIMPTVDEEGTYFLTVFDNQNGCQSLDSTTVALDFEEPIANIAAPGLLTCTDTTLTLDGTASSSGSGFSYLWTHDNEGIVAGNNTAEALIQAPGQYVLQVQNTTNGCLTTDTVLVQEDVEYPDIQIAPPGRLSCAVPTLTLDAAGSSEGSSYELAWTTQDGNILGNADGLQTVINGAGAYQLEIRNQSNNCSSVAGVEVQIDTLPPLADAGPALALNCQQPAATLDGSASASGADISYSWTTTDGNILNGNTTDSPLVDEAGTYQLQVFNADNSCSSEATVAVSKDVTPPVAAVPLPDTLDCNLLSVPLDASGSTGESLSFQWSTLNGQIADGSNQALATVNAPGTYALLLTNTENFCRDTLQITVTQDTITPSGQIASPPMLNCALTQTALSATADGNYTFNWSTDNGNILNGETSPQPLVNAPGQYELRLLDPSNGCTEELAVEVQQDTLSPLASVLPPMELNCERTSLTLDATASSTDPNLVYQWTSENGNILNGADSPQALVDAPGAYRFTIRNTVNFCTDSLQVSVTQDTLHPTVSITPPDTLDCVTPEVSLAGSSVGSGNDFAYNWSSNGGLLLGGNNEATATAGEPGQYLLEVTDLNNQCRSEAQVSVAQDTLPPEILIAPADTLTCDVLQITLDGSASSAGSEMSYQWSSVDGSLLGNSTMPNTLTNTAGTYQLLILNTQNGCRDSATVSVPQDTVAPAVNLLPPDILNCITSSVPLMAADSDAGPDFTIEWSGPAGGFASGTDGLSPEVVRPGNYSLTIENLANGCRSTRSVLVEQDTVPPIADAGADFVIPCFPELRQLDGSASSAGAIYSYSWATDNGVLENGGSTLTPTIDGPGSYTLSILNTQNGCSASDIVLVSQDIPQAAAELVQPPCFGDFGQLQIGEVQGGTPPYVYSVDGGGQFQSEPRFSSLPPGTYEWVVQDVQGCEDQATFTVEQPDSLIVRVVPEEVELQLGDSLQVSVESNYPLSALQNIAWQAAPGLSCYDCLNPVAMPLQTTDYYLTVSTADGCADQLRLRIYVDKGNPVYLPNVFSPNNDGANDFFYPQAKPGTVRNIRDFRLFDRWGEAVFQNQDFLPNDPIQGWDGRLRGERANTAVFAYFLEVEFIDGRVELLKGDVLLMR